MQQRKIAAGKRTEKDVAYYLDKELEGDKDLFIFHNIRFTDGTSNTQIDHLVLYKYGFILIESKSIYGEVRVNGSGEWSRSYRGNWTGMMSPIRQLEIQVQGLKSFLRSHRKLLLDKTILGLYPGFGGRNYDALCAVSSTAIIHRDDAPKHIIKNVFKAEFIGVAVRGVLNRMNITSPEFSASELKAVAEFLASLKEHDTSEQPESFKQSVEAGTSNSLSAPAVTESTLAQCKHCQSCNVVPQSGRYGYYFKCQQCTKNTAMPVICPQCEGSAKSRKKGSLFYLDCQACRTETPLIMG